MERRWKWVLGIGGLLAAGFTVLHFTVVDLGGVFRLESHGPTVLVGTQKNEFKGPATDLSVALGVPEKQAVETAGRRDKARKDLEEYQSAIQTAKAALEKLKQEYGEAEAAQNKRLKELQDSLATIADLRKQNSELAKEVARQKAIADDALSKLRKQSEENTLLKRGDVSASKFGNPVQTLNWYKCMRSHGAHCIIVGRDNALVEQCSFDEATSDRETIQSQCAIYLPRK